MARDRLAPVELAGHARVHALAACVITAARGYRAQVCVAIAGGASVAVEHAADQVGAAPAAGRGAQPHAAGSQQDVRGVSRVENPWRGVEKVVRIALNLRAADRGGAAEPAPGAVAAARAAENAHALAHVRIPVRRSVGVNRHVAALAGEQLLPCPRPALRSGAFAAHDAKFTHAREHERSVCGAHGQVTDFGQRTDAAVQVVEVRCVCGGAHGAGLRYIIGGAPQAAVIAEKDRLVRPKGGVDRMDGRRHLCRGAGRAIGRVAPCAAVRKRAAEDVLGPGKQERILLRLIRDRGERQVVVGLRNSPVRGIERRVADLVSPGDGIRGVAGAHGCAARGAHVLIQTAKGFSAAIRAPIHIVQVGGQREGIAGHWLYGQDAAKNGALRASQPARVCRTILRRQVCARLVRKPRPGYAVGRGVVAVKPDRRQEQVAFRVPHHRGSRIPRGRRLGVARLDDVIRAVRDGGQVPGLAGVFRVVQPGHRRPGDVRAGVDHEPFQGLRNSGDDQVGRGLAPGKPGKARPDEAVARDAKIAALVDLLPCVAAICGAQDACAVVRVQRIVRVARTREYVERVIRVYGDGAYRNTRVVRRVLEHRKIVSQRLKRNAACATGSVCAFPYTPARGAQIHGVAGRVGRVDRKRTDASRNEAIPGRAQLSGSSRLPRGCVGGEIGLRSGERGLRNSPVRARGAHAGHCASARCSVFRCSFRNGPSCAWRRERCSNAAIEQEAPVCCLLVSGRGGCLRRAYSRVSRQKQKKRAAPQKSQYHQSPFTAAAVLAVAAHPHCSVVARMISGPGFRVTSGSKTSGVVGSVCKANALRERLLS